MKRLIKKQAELPYTVRQELDVKVPNPQLNIWIGHLLQYHNYKYPIDWYLSLPESQVKGMYNEYLKQFAYI